MILKASQRGGSKQLAAHLLKTTENEHVAVHELRGFSGDDLHSALHEIYAVSRGTRAKQFLFSLSLSPPPSERVSVETFETAIEAVEQKLGLTGQPRAVVFHEKEGRRHAHVVWSRIDSERMKAINLPHFKLKLRDVSRELYLEHGWKMPRGFVNSRERDPHNFSRAEWEQAKRAKQNPKALKAMFQECWSSSDSKKAFAQALQARGYMLARGDRRGHVAVDFRGEIYAVSKWAGVRAKDVRSRLGSGDDLPSVAEAEAFVAGRMTEMLRRHISAAETRHTKDLAALAFQRSQIVEKQRKERADLEHALVKRWERDSAERAKRLNKGFRGIWDRLTGAYARTAKTNEREALIALRRDQQEKDGLIIQHLDERQAHHQRAKQIRATHAQEVEQLHRDVATFTQAKTPDRLKSLRDRFQEAARERGNSHQVAPAKPGPEWSI